MTFHFHTIKNLAYLKSVSKLYTDNLNPWIYIYCWNSIEPATQFGTMPQKVIWSECSNSTTWKCAPTQAEKTASVRESFDHRETRMFLLTYELGLLKDEMVSDFGIKSYLLTLWEWINSAVHRLILCLRSYTLWQSSSN